MTGSLRQTWIYTQGDLWEPLATFSTKDASAPPDIFTDLFESVNDYLAVPTPEPEFGEILNDDAKASARFLTLKGTDFVSESAIVEFLEAAHEAITDYDLPGYEELFKRLLREFLRKYNLRYRLDDPFTLRFLLPGSFTNLYGELQRLTTKDKHLSELIRDFEHSFNQYARSNDPTDLKTCIHKASNLAEGLASHTMNYPKKNTLGALCDQIKSWPHDKVGESLKNLYSFCSDYAGVRHSGRPKACNRTLDQKDCVLTCLLLLSFSGYLASGVDAQEILGSWTGGGPKRPSRRPALRTDMRSTRETSWISRLIKGTKWGRV
jgi:hypothetical protein